MELRMKRLVSIIACAMLFIFVIRPGSVRAQCGNAPKLEIQADTIDVFGEAVHISGVLPQHSDRWFYHVSCQSPRLFNFSLWTVDRFSDRDGFFVAKSWNLQILDSREHPERGVIFFWGNLIKTPKGVKVSVKSIVGFPEGIRGDVIIREVPHKQVQDHR